MKIKQFCAEYMNRVDRLKDQYLRDNLKITAYVPFVRKDVLAQKLVDISTYKYEDYAKEDGTIGRRKTSNIHVNSTVQYLLFCRLIIENYTNLEVETEGFFEEYDALKQSGLLDKLMVGSENESPLIPMGEIAEFRTIVDMKQKDEMTNYATPQSYISSQVNRFEELIGVILKPVLEKLSDQLENLDEKDIEKISKALECGLKRVK